MGSGMFIDSARCSVSGGEQVNKRLGFPQRARQVDLRSRVKHDLGLYAWRQLTGELKIAGEWGREGSSEGLNKGFGAGMG